MINSHLNRLSIFGCLVLLVTLALGGSVAAQTDEGYLKTSFQQVTTHPPGDIVVIPATGATLSRTARGVYFSMNTQGLPAGHVVTAWMGVFNNPKACASSPCDPMVDFPNLETDGSLLYTGGRLIGLDGAATYGAYRAVGDTTGAHPQRGTGNGLLNPFGAEVFVALRDHGPALLGDQALFAQQLNSFGFCNGPCANIQLTVFQR